MTVWTINDYTIAGFVQKRNIATPWFQVDENIYGTKALIRNTVRGAQPFHLNIVLRDSGRYTAEAAIRTELKSDSVLIEASDKYIHKNKRSIWVVPTGFNVKDQDQTLECELAGFIDERTLHSCDFITNWTGNSISLDTDTRFSEGCIKDSSISSAQTTLFTPTEAYNINSMSFVGLWHKESKSISAQLRLYTNSDYFRWDLTASTTWTHESFDLASPDVTSGSPSLANITSLGVYSSSTSTWDVYIGWVYVE